VVFTGHLADSEIPLLNAMAIIFRFPSFAEGFGLPPLDAMASGTPVIVSNTTAMSEICGDACLYFDLKNTKELASQIKKLTKDEGLYSKLKEKGIERAKSFSWSEAAHKINLVFQKIIKQ
jgi:glycosyltransferase involved in cell wall biosynthesis